MYVRALKQASDKQIPSCALHNVHMEHVLVGTLACAFVLKIGAFVHVDQVEEACHGHLSMPMEWNGSEGKV